MALRRVLPSRVTLPEAEHKVAPSISPVEVTVTEHRPVATPEPKADIAALGALMADEITPQSAPTRVPPPQIESAMSEPVVSLTEELPQPDASKKPLPEQETSVLAEPVPVEGVPAIKPETPPQPSRPDDNPMRRRPKQPRAFTYTPVSEETSVEVAESVEGALREPSALSPSPVADTTPLTEVDDRLQQAGVIPAPMADELTGSLPPAPSVAGETSFAQELPEFPTPPQSMPEPLPTVVPAMEEAVSVQASTSQVITNADETTSAPGPQSSSDLPWATAPHSVPDTSSTAPAPDASDWFGSWNSTGQGADNAAPETTPAMPPAPVPTPDLYGSLKSGTGQGGVNLPPPEIVGQFPGRPSRGGGGSGISWQVGVAAAVVAAALFGAYQLVNKDSRAKTPQLAADIPASAESAQTTAPLLPPQVDASPSNLFAGTGIEGMGTPTDASSNAVIAFADVSPDQAGKPIVADGTEKMPDDVSFIARLQGAIEAEKARKDGQLPSAAPVSATSAGAAPSDPSLEQRRLQGEDLRAQLADELAAYRKALAESPSKMEAPKPADFLGQKTTAPIEATTSTSLDSEGAPVETPNGSLLPPPQLAGGNAVPPAELYKNNPNNLPVVPEPASAEAAKVRQLTDFDVAMFTPERDRIRIPTGIRPHFSTSGFPELEVLSFVPGKGVIAYKDGKEGVLLIGESVDGWELTTVNADNAEFKNGQRSQYVTAE